MGQERKVRRKEGSHRCFLLSRVRPSFINIESEDRDQPQGCWRGHSTVCTKLPQLDFGLLHCAFCESLRARQCLDILIILVSMFLQRTFLALCSKTNRGFSPLIISIISCRASDLGNPCEWGVQK